MVPLLIAMPIGCGDDSHGTGNNNNNNQSQPVCGNGQIETGEECDEGEQNSDAAPNACRTSCRSAYCGDGVIDQGEACDSASLDNTTCENRGYTAGTLVCSETCSFDESGCTTCGNGAAEGSVPTAPGYEACDGDDLRSQSCPSQGRPLGLLGCNTDCSFDYDLCTGALPVITAVEGTGSATPIGPRPEDQAVYDQTANKQLATRRINSQVRELELRGANIGGATAAQAVGQDSQGTIDFEVQTGGTNEMVRIRFPQALSVARGGLFLLTLTTAYGPAQAQVFFLQGEAGVCSNTVTGDLTVTGNVNIAGTTTTTGQITAPGVNAGNVTAQSATVAGLSVTSVYALPPCPEGYEEDTSVFGGAYPEVHVCVHPVSGDEMVRVGDFWIDRYETSLWSGPTCTGTQYGSGTTDNYPAGFPDTGHATTPIYSCSVPGVTPSCMMTWFQARQACEAMGKRLCTNAEWQAAVSGTFDPGSAEGAGTAQCRIASTNTGPRQTGQTGATPASQFHCISRFGAEDMVGNLWEWTADWYVAGRPWQTADDQSQCPSGCTFSTGGWLPSYGGDATWSLNGRAHDGVAYEDGVPSAALRGGSWANAAKAGAFAVSLNAGPSSWAADIGARCCRSR